MELRLRRRIDSCVGQLPEKSFFARSIARAKSGLNNNQINEIMNFLFEECEDIGPKSDYRDYLDNLSRLLKPKKSIALQEKDLEDANKSIEKLEHWETIPEEHRSLWFPLSKREDLIKKRDELQQKLKEELKEEKIKVEEERAKLEEAFKICFDHYKYPIDLNLNKIGEEITYFKLRLSVSMSIRSDKYKNIYIDPKIILEPKLGLLNSGSITAPVSLYTGKWVLEKPKEIELEATFKDLHNAEISSNTIEEAFTSITKFYLDNSAKKEKKTISIDFSDMNYLFRVDITIDKSNQFHNSHGINYESLIIL